MNVDYYSMMHFPKLKYNEHVYSYSYLLLIHVYCNRFKTYLGQLVYDWYICIRNLLRSDLPWYVY